jgi:hypothetical protein
VSARHGLPGRVQRPNSRPRQVLVVPLDPVAQARVEDSRVPLDLADAVLAVTVAGAEADGIETLAEACRARGLALTGIVLPGNRERLSHSLGQLRPWVGTLLVADGDEDVLHLAEVLHGRQ